MSSLLRLISSVSFIPRHFLQISSGSLRRLGVACAVMSSVVLVGQQACAQPESNAQLTPASAVVSLPMYEVSDRVKKADDVFWNRLQLQLEKLDIHAPATLERTRGELIDQWQDQHLLLSQTCGYPYTHTLMGKGVKIVGTPVYSTNDDLPAGHYQSVIIVNANAPYKDLTELKGKIAGFNEKDSNSGMNVFRAAVAKAFPRNELETGIFKSVKATGGHMVSVREVGNGTIDVAAIDDVSYDLITRDHPEVAAKTRILMKTESAPGLPMITSANTDDETIAKIRGAIKQIVTTPQDQALSDALADMKLKDFVVIDQKQYMDRIYELENAAIDKGYPSLK